MINNPGYFFFSKDLLKDSLRGRPAQGGPPARRRNRHLDLGNEQFDLITVFMGYHDLYWVDESNGWPKINAGGVLDQLNRALKPGGKLLIVDHAAKERTGTSAATHLHRIDEAFAGKDIASHGFLFEKAWPGYRSSIDDHTKEVFDESIRHKTDRFTHLYRKKSTPAHSTGVVSM